MSTMTICVREWQRATERASERKTPWMTMMMMTVTKTVPEQWWIRLSFAFFGWNGSAAAAVGAVVVVVVDAILPFVVSIQARFQLQIIYIMNLVVISDLPSTKQQKKATNTGIFIPIELLLRRRHRRCWNEAPGALGKWENHVYIHIHTAHFSALLFLFDLFCPYFVHSLFSVHHPLLIERCVLCVVAQAENRLAPYWSIQYVFIHLSS